MAGSDFDMRDHKRTYSGFLALCKWGIILNVLLLVVMAATLTP